ncbi:hypothetical protein [Burkholderia pseudomultivorans]|uniref:hypothetical protein n=1 Tax=Burkholderia pseudomultivorans TaxID=1207504 RepID=UPI00075E894F|nr:hypothetical protein [Burkholderia pseudomultivorans]KWF11473.1 hypothetical protein WT55_10165 [Burkholderia pseudomultivorans]
MKKSRRSIVSIVRLGIAVPIALLLIAYAWGLTRAHLELGGSEPNQRILGRALDDGQRAMEQACTGVVAVGRSVWLVGRRESDDDKARLRDAVNLDALLPAGSTPDTGEREVSQVSRLGDDGVFHTMAYVSGYACPLPSADKTSLLLLTGAHLPEGNDGRPVQTAVFRADEHGKDWRIVPGGFMADAEWLAWSLDPYFHGSNDVWAAGQGRFFHSSDQGAHADAVEGTERLWDAPSGTLPQTPGSGGDTAAHLIQFNDRQATAWVSQSYWDGTSTLQTFTREAQLTRRDGRWEVGDIRTTPGLYLFKVKDNGAGRVVAELSRSSDAGHELAELGQDGRSWNRLGDLPNPFWPLPASTMIRPNQQTSFYVSGPVILVTTMSTHTTVQLTGKAAHIEGNGVFFSTDSGRHWKKLAIPGYLGVLGFDADRKAVYWTKGNEFENRDPAIYVSDLAQ